MNQNSHKSYKPKIRHTLLFALIGILIIQTSCSNNNSHIDNNSVLSVVPYPKEVKFAKGSLMLKENTNINLSDHSLLPFADLLSNNIEILTGNRPMIRPGETSKSGINLILDPDMSEDEYHLRIKKSIDIRAGSIVSMINGSYTLLQIIGSPKDNVLLPQLEIIDTADSEYRGLMIDLARNWHDMSTIYKLIDLAAYYKVNFVQLHFTDYQSYTLPSNHLPELSTENRHYSFEDLEKIERYALLRGIAIVPELDIPGHAMAMVNAYPELFGIKDISDNPYTINMGKEEVYAALEILINEIIDVFDSSPYFHIGGDEAIFDLLDQDPDVQEYMINHELGDDIHELYRHFIVRMNDIVKARGKQLCVWEGFRRNGEVAIPKDILVFEYETSLYLPCELISDGYNVVNASWKPLYVVREKKWSPEYIYEWNMWRWENWFHKVPSFTPIQCEQSAMVIGGQMCAWEQPQELEFPSLRRRVPAFIERVWTAEKKRDVTEFMLRLNETDKVLSILLNDFRQDTLAAFNK